MAIVHRVGLSCLKPFLVTSHALSSALGKTAEAWGRFRSLYRRYGELENQVGLLERELVEKAELEKENERLRKLLEFREGIPQETVPARVIGRDLAPWRKTILIDKGSGQGIRKRMAIVNAQGLVGRVIEVGPNTARAILLLDSESRVSVIFQESRDLGVAEGNGSSWIRVTRLEREAAIQVGDLVLSSGLGQVYPKGLPVGRVEIVGNEKEGLELFAVVRPVVDFSKLEEVLCVASSPAAS